MRFLSNFMTEISTKKFPLEISDYQYFLETSEHGLKCWKMFQQPLSIFQSYLKGSIVFFAQINVKRPFGIFFVLAAGGDLIEFSLLPVIM